MSLGRRLPAAAVAMLLAAVGLAPPAGAEPSVRWSRPTVEDALLDESGPIRGTIEGEENDRIERLEFELATDPPGTGPQDPCVAEAPDATVVYTEGNRNEDFEVDIDFPCNRRYQLTAIVGYGDSGLANTVIPPDPVRATLNFSVAIPPARVQGFEATYDEGSKEVRLSWAQNAERDLLGYMVERNPPGPEGFSRIGPDLVAPGDTSFTDTGIDEEHRYRIVAVRQGPDSGSRLLGEASIQRQVGPERSEPTLPDDLPAPNARPPAASGGSSSATRPPAPAPSGRTRTTSNVFEETLPFDPSQTTLPSPDTTGAVADDGQAAVLAEFDDESSEDRRRATLVPIAGGLALVMGAMHLFLLAKRASEPEIPITRR